MNTELAANTSSVVYTGVSPEHARDALHNAAEALEHSEDALGHSAATS